METATRGPVWHCGEVSVKVYEVWDGDWEVGGGQRGNSRKEIEIDGIKIQMHG